MVVICFMHKSLSTSFMQSEVNCVPMSLKISSGKPSRENKSSSASATFSVVMLFNATASGYLVA